MTDQGGNKRSLWRRAAGYFDADKGNRQRPGFVRAARGMLNALRSMLPEVRSVTKKVWTRKKVRVKAQAGDLVEAASG